MKKGDAKYLELASRVCQRADQLEPDIWRLNQFIFTHPELGLEEYKSAAEIVSDLQRFDFKMEMAIGGLDTAFKAVRQGKAPTPTIAFLAEYDALPDIGHGCGHNFIGTASTYAAVSLSAVINELQGRIMVIGTPAEETDGGKIMLLEKGVFDEVDVAMMVHPSTETRIFYKSLAAQVVELEFRGQPAHAAAAPWKGVNALDALIQTFVAIDNLKKQLKPTVRIPGIITHGGTRANIVPERAVGVFSVRAESTAELKQVVEKVLLCAEGAALATGAHLNYRFADRPYFEMQTNESLAMLFQDNWRQLGGQISEDQDKGMGSVDIGNVSHSLPCIHPSIRVTDKPIAGHTREFGQETVSLEARPILMLSIKTLALTALDLMYDNSFYNKTCQEFKKQVSTTDARSP